MPTHRSSSCLLFIPACWLLVVSGRSFWVAMQCARCSALQTISAFLHLAQAHSSQQQLCRVPLCGLDFMLCCNHCNRCVQLCLASITPAASHKANPTTQWPTFNVLCCLVLPGGKVCKTSDEKHGSVKLPDTCLTKIMEYIADTLEPGGLRGPSCVARELYNASLVRIPAFLVSVCCFWLCLPCQLRSCWHRPRRKRLKQQSTPIHMTTNINPRQLSLC